MDTIIYVVGPTGIGKTAIATYLADRFNGELVNADSVQVYKGLNIISGKDHAPDVPLQLIDVVSPFETFSVSRFQEIGEQKIGEIISRRKQPIVIGGSGLYVKSLVDGISTSDIPSNENLRLQLKSLSVEELQNKLSHNRLKEMNNSDRNNKRRLIRAIEIEGSKFNTPQARVPFQNMKKIMIGLFARREVINEKIDNRVDGRMKNGALKEAEVLFSNYSKLTNQVKNTNGYKQLFRYLKKEITLPQAVSEWKVSEHQLAKNQMTWFKKDSRIIWFDVEGDEFKNKIADVVKQAIL